MSKNEKRLEEVLQMLGRGGFRIGEISRLPNDYGSQVKVEGGPVVNVFDSGKIVVQGKPGQKEAVAEVLGIAESKTPVARPTRRSVFVVYGHDEGAKVELEAILRRWGIEPLLLDQLPSEGLTIIEKLEKYQSEADFGIVLATPDDEGHRVGVPAEKRYRARQNVVLELGMLLQVLGRTRVAILIKDVQNMERPSDIQGLIYLPFADAVNDIKVVLAKEMVKQGFKIDISKL
jgi:predicted nucleotide-binding protein